MTQTTSMILLIVLFFALAGHYLSQKALLAKGWKADDPKPHIKRLSINGGALLVLALVALATAKFPFGLIGILLFIEAAACLAFAKKLRNR
ncbi:MAG: hypothetical protein DRP64_09060 [Verrucomicrobia bacterium]|nr:MAG: hypothetical protein DRP64_09060 [Verrucomicrobiota bacterium]